MWSKLTLKLGNRLGSVSSPALGPYRDFWMMPDARPQSYEYNLRFYNECTFLRQAYIFSWDHVTLTLRFLNNSRLPILYWLWTETKKRWKSNGIPHALLQTYIYKLHINLTCQCCVDIVIKLQIILAMFRMIIIRVVEFNQTKRKII